jgi:hypothetical protein
MSTVPRCHCQSCTIRGLMWPAIIITLGILLLLHQLHGGHFDIGYTWPTVLMVVGFLLLASSVASREGHIDVTAGAPLHAPPAPPGNAPQPPQGSQGR